MQAVQFDGIEEHGAGAGGEGRAALMWEVACVAVPTAWAVGLACVFTRDDLELLVRRDPLLRVYGRRCGLGGVHSPPAGSCLASSKLQRQNVPQRPYWRCRYCSC